MTDGDSLDPVRAEALARRFAWARNPLTLALADDIVRDAMDPKLSPPCVLTSRDDIQCMQLWMLCGALPSDEARERKFENVIYLTDYPGNTESHRTQSFSVLFNLLEWSYSRIGSMVKHLTIAGPGPTWTSPDTFHLRPSINFDVTVKILSNTPQLVRFGVGGFDWVAGAKRGWQVKVPPTLSELRLGGMHALKNTSCMDLLELRQGVPWKLVVVGNVHHSSPKISGRRSRAVEEMVVCATATLSAAHAPRTLSVTHPAVHELTRLTFTVVDQRQALCLIPIVSTCASTLRVLSLIFKTERVVYKSTHTLLTTLERCTALTSLSFEFTVDSGASETQEAENESQHPLNGYIADWVWGMPRRSRGLRTVGVRVNLVQGGSAELADAFLDDMQRHWPRFGMATGCMPNLEFMFLDITGKDEQSECYYWSADQVAALGSAWNLMKAGARWRVAYVMHDAQTIALSTRAVSGLSDAIFELENPFTVLRSAT